MARIRTIKPEFFKHETVAELPAMARLLFIGLFTLADCEGKMEDRPKRIKAEIFPYDNVNIEDLLSKLQSAGFIIRYEVGELKLMIIPTFTKHQRFQTKELSAGSDLPNPPQSSIEQLEHNKNDTGTIPEQNGDDTGTIPGHAGKEGKGKEKEGKGKDTPIGSPPDSTNQGNSKGIKIPPPGSAPPPPVVLPFDSEKFKLIWDNWKQYKFLQFRFKYKSPQSEQAALADLVKECDGTEQNAIDIITQSMANGWKGFFKLKDNGGKEEKRDGTQGQQLNKAFADFYSRKK